MLNPFPFLLDYHLYGPTLLRVVLGVYVVFLGSSKLPKSRPELVTFFESLGLRPASYYLYPLALGEIIAGLCLVMGLMTQIASGVIAVVSLVSLIITAKKPAAKLRPAPEYVFVLVIALALMIMGAGRFAFDWPL